MKYRIYQNKTGKYKIKCSYALGLLWFDLQDVIKESINSYGGKSRPFPGTRTVLFATIGAAKARIIQEKKKDRTKVDGDKWSYIGKY